jgi:hypothetical protein
MCESFLDRHGKALFVRFGLRSSMGRCFRCSMWNSFPFTHHSRGWHAFVAPNGLHCSLWLNFVVHRTAALMTRQVRPSVVATTRLSWHNSALVARRSTAYIAPRSLCCSMVTCSYDLSFYYSIWSSLGYLWWPSRSLRGGLRSSTRPCCSMLSSFFLRFRCSKRPSSLHIAFLTPRGLSCSLLDMESLTRRSLGCFVQRSPCYSMHPLFIAVTQPSLL